MMMATRRKGKDKEKIIKVRGREREKLDLVHLNREDMVSKD